MRVGVLHYGLGNYRSVLNMVAFLGYDATHVTEVSGLKEIDALIIPGVGSFDAGMKGILACEGMADAIRELTTDRKLPLLGVCLGAQLLLSTSDEGKLPGLGLIPGKSELLKPQNDAKVPHVGWNTVELVGRNSSPASLSGHSYYFVHSYAMKPTSESHVLGITFHGQRFASIVGRDNILGAQFHPEKSHKSGMQFLRGFLDGASA